MLQYGGGIYVDLGTLHAQGCTISGNAARVSISEEFNLIQLSPSNNPLQRPLEVAFLEADIGCALFGRGE